MPTAQNARQGTTRRGALKLLAALGVVGGALRSVAARAGVDTPNWPANAFHSKNQTDAVKALYGKDFTPSDKISLDVPEIAENGAVVPVALATTLPNVTSMSILVPENPFTIAASYTFPAGTAPSIACRLKMAKTSEVLALIESDGKLFSTTKTVKVTLGGCGG
ncbi:MAG: thiosulfate oxidation carrier protein SoxY [Rhodospirillales bacterium]|nr:thiosulfate oxidation carrier protein SoxY [Rhodospirillales bacterium]MDE2198793.1 thiosulfate oxidation carrier protein SoxY [Rhodospirillales bacterium]MDE2575004.1 thiosulfate oxidation carrier protein SoxY [Rhodospirillales bacterium]